ncbi:hypothetical protein [Burkholderia gladioli]|uniref:hypothetical protein n=1 Tax=Burkholderia gladioli TaxID=28095 RepID=UPI00163E75BE|nr:hypothetical protein [Burkholderia gladioli]
MILLRSRCGKSSTIINPGNATGLLVRETRPDSEFGETMIKLSVLLGLAVLASSVPAQSVYVPHGFTTGNDYQQMTPIERGRFDVGVFDGFMAAPMLAEKDLPQARALQRCSGAMSLTNVQLVAIVDKYVADNPERWGDDMSVLELNAIIAACRKIGYPIK